MISRTVMVWHILLFSERVQSVNNFLTVYSLKLTTLIVARQHTISAMYLEVVLPL